MDTILIIDDEEALCRSLEKILSREGLKVVWTTRSSGVEDLIHQNNPSAVLLDLKLADSDGLTILSRIRETDRELPVIILTAHDTVKTAVQAMKKGAFDYMAKPFDNEELKVVLAKAIEQRRLYKKIGELKGRLGDVSDLEGLMGTSQRIQEVIKAVRMVAATDVNVLLMGETGTGKELVANAIHRLSNRKNGPFVPVDCGSVPETLIESNLFGHEKGAFTGASATQKGKFETANGGTLFLDELGNIPLPVQSKLLRFLETRKFERLGSRKPIDTLVRIIAATNADLTKKSPGEGNGGFRLDLFHRLNEFPILLPPLRERREDIPFLCQKFVVQLKGEVGKEVSGISSEALQKLVKYPFEGNVRELRNIIKRSMVMANGTIDVSDLPAEVRNPSRSATPRQISVPVDENLPLSQVSRQATEKIERELIVGALARTDGHHEKASRLLGITRKTLYNKMKEYGI